MSPTKTARKPEPLRTAEPLRNQQKAHKRAPKEDEGGVAVAEAPPEAQAPDDITFDDLPPSFQKIIDDRVNEVVKNALVGSQPGPSPFQSHTFPGEPASGQIVAQGTIPPQGWQVISKDNGVFELWPMPTAEQRNTTLRMDILKLVDESFQKAIPTKEFPDRLSPTHLVVNKAWRKLFKYQRTWGDTCDVVVIGYDENSPDEVASSKSPMFRFEVEDDDEELEAA